jgi:DnaJ-class molecular chaperone
MRNQDYYQRLGISRQTDQANIKKAYANKVKQYPNETHPEQFRLIREAYDTLKDPEKRRHYDASLSSPRPTTSTVYEQPSVQNAESNQGESKFSWWWCCCIIIVFFVVQNLE